MNQFKMALLVDDDPINNFLSYAVLIRAKIVKDIQIESNGENALIFLQKYYASHRSLPELIFLDINMPILDGLEFLKLFNEKFDLLKGKTTIIILSNSINEKEKSQAEKSGIKYFVQKPLCEDLLKELTANLSGISLASAIPNL